MTYRLDESDDSDNTDTRSDTSIDLSNPHINRKEISKLLGMRPKNLDYYRRAFVHKSINRNVKKAKDQRVLEYMTESNERLELLGDSVLGLIVTNYLFDKFPEKAEGFLTRTKTKIVRREGCAKFARHIGLGDYILTSDHIKIDKTKDKILEDTFEAFVGAIYKDLGMTFSTAFVTRLIEECIDFNTILIDNNYKDVLLRYSQSKNYPLPIYEEVAKEGPAHGCKFTMSAKLITGSGPKDYLIANGKEKSKKQAEQEAAKFLLSKIDKYDLEIFINRDKMNNLKI
jgi:ribonuclease III